MNLPKNRRTARLYRPAVAEVQLPLHPLGAGWGEPTPIAPRAPPVSGLSGFACAGLYGGSAGSGGVGLRREF